MFDAAVKALSQMVSPPFRSVLLKSVAVALALVGFVLGSGRAGRALAWFALAAALGCALVWTRSSWVSQPRLSRPQVADVAGRVEYVDYLVARGTVRLTVAPAGRHRCTPAGWDGSQGRSGPGGS